MYFLLFIQNPLDLKKLIVIYLKMHPDKKTILGEANILHYLFWV